MIQSLAKCTCTCIVTFFESHRQSLDTSEWVLEFVSINICSSFNFGLEISSGKRVSSPAGSGH